MKISNLLKVISERKLTLLLTVCLLAVAFAISYGLATKVRDTEPDNNGLSISSASDATGSDASPDNESECKIHSNIKEKSEYDNTLNSKLSWWFKRDVEHGPSGCDDTVDISEYDGYYLDLTKSANNEKVLYLTFDCGYENGYTEKILDVLKKYNVSACFFVTKTYVRDNVELVKRMKAEGHMVGNHTVSHPSMPDESYEELLKEINDTAEYMKEKTGYYMDPYLRPPRGEYSARTLEITRDLGYKTIFWSMAYLDYDVNKQPGAAYVIEHFNKFHHCGAIILMHNVSESNAAALETVIKNMEAQGYRFVSLEELE